MKKPGQLLIVILALLAVMPARSAERVWVHCDRSLYAAGETIWLRGWVSDPEGEVPTSKFLYVELLRDGIGSVEQRIKLKERGGMFFGQMELPDDMDSGWYTLRAYTRAQKDWPAEALFHTRLLIRGAGAVPGLTANYSSNEAAASDIRVTLSPSDNGHLAVSLTDAAGKPVAGNFSLSVVRDSYANFDFQQAPAAVMRDYPEGDREYRQDMEFRIKSVHRKLPKKYQVSVMSQDIGYYYTEDVAYDKRLLTEEGQSFRIPDIDFPDGTLFTLNVIGSMFIFPGEEPESFAAPFDYGPIYRTDLEIRDSTRIVQQLEGTVAPVQADDTLTALVITAEKKDSYYRPERPVGPYSNVFEWRQVRLREDLQKYDDMDLLTYIAHSFPGIHVGWTDTGRMLYTNRGASFTGSGATYHTVALYIDNMQMEWGEAMNYSVRDIQSLYVLRGAEAALYRATAVVLLETRRFDPAYIKETSSPASIKTIGIQPLGYQLPKSFSRSPSLNPDRQGTYYWNPVIRTDINGHADIYLPELTDSYYLRLEGQTLDGRWFFVGRTMSL